MAEQWKRWFSLIVADDGGAGIDLRNFRAVFSIRQWEGSTPNVADVTVYNLAPATVAKMGKEFTQISIRAGYEGSFGQIFQGSIIQFASGRENQTDTFARITAQDADTAHNFAVVNQSLAAGATADDVHKAVCTAMNPYGVQQGYTPPFHGPALPRGRVLYGMARDVMDQNARSNNMQWTIVDGRVQVIPIGGYLPDEAVVLTANTGLIGMPTTTLDGIMVRCLLNPNLRVNGRIKLDNRSIQPFMLPVDPLGRAQIAQNVTPRGAEPGGLVPSTQADGIYRILAIDHVGDTRGTPWYSEIVCISADPNAIIPPGQIQRGRGGDGPAPLPPQPATAANTPPTDRTSPDFNPRFGEPQGGA